MKSVACMVLFVIVMTAPLAAQEAQRAQLESYPGTVSFDFKNVTVRNAAEYVARTAGFKVTVCSDLAGKTLSLKLVNAFPEQALSLIARQVDAVLRAVGDKVYMLEMPPVMNVTYKNAPLRLVLNQIARQANLNMIVSPTVSGTVNLRLKNVPWREALQAVVHTAEYTLVEEDTGVVRVVQIAELRDQVMTRVFYLKYIQPPDYYQPIIRTDFTSGTNKKILDELAREAAQAQEKVAQSGGLREAISKQSKSGPPFSLLNAVGNILSAVGSVEYDPFSNAFIVTDIKPKIDEVAKLIKKLDVPPAQVFIDVKFISTTRSDLSNFGVDWSNGITGSLQMGSVSSRFPFTRGKGGWEDNFAVVDDGPPKASYDPVTGALVPAGTIIPEDGGFTFGTLDFSDLQQVVNAFKADAESKVIQAPKLLTLDNRESTIFVGSNIRFAETFRSSSQNGNPTDGIREADTSPVETGFQLLIIPHVIKGRNKILMTIIPEDESLVARPTLQAAPADLLPGFERFTSGPDVIDLPQIQKRTVVSRIMVEDGMTIVLGGLIVETHSKTITKVPFLGDIPLAGWIFKNEIDRVRKENLIIFLTIKIVYNEEDVRKLYRVHRKFEGGYASPVEKLFIDPDAKAPKKEDKKEK